MEEKPVPLLFLDIDGTVRHGLDETGRWIETPDDVTVFPEAVTRMQEWRDQGGRIVGVSNQGGIALGYLTDETCRDIMQRTQDLTGDLFDIVMWCRHHPNAESPGDADCWGRKPMPGIIFETVSMLMEEHEDECYPPNQALMVGDRPNDRECAARAGIRFQWAVDWRAGRLDTRRLEWVQLAPDDATRPPA